MERVSVAPSCSKRISFDSSANSEVVDEEGEEEEEEEEEEEQEDSSSSSSSSTLSSLFSLVMGSREMKGGIVVVVGVFEGVGVASGANDLRDDVVAVVVVEVVEFLGGETIGWTVATGGRIGGGRGRAAFGADRRAEDGANRTGSILSTCSKSSGDAVDAVAETFIREKIINHPINQ